MSFRLLSFEADRGPRAGVLIGDKVHDIAALTGRADYASMLSILADWDDARSTLAGISVGSVEGGVPLEAVRLLAPILYPGQIWAAGANYQDHIGEMDDSEFPAINAKTISGGRPWHFSKSARGAIVGPGSENALPEYSQKVDWEIELAVVIGREGYRIPAKEALDYVAGYTIANDLSARDFVAREGIPADSPFRFDWLSHKGFRGACPMGPWIVPASEVPDPHNLNMKLWVDDDLKQDSNTRHMIFDIGEQIEEISARVPIFPGDVILTGTPSGVGMGQGVFLKPGQSVRLWIEKIGELRHSFA